MCFNILLCLSVFVNIALCTNISHDSSTSNAYKLIKWEYIKYIVYKCLYTNIYISFQRAMVQPNSLLLQYTLSVFVHRQLGANHLSRQRAFYYLSRPYSVLSMFRKSSTIPQLYFKFTTFKQFEWNISLSMVVGFKTRLCVSYLHCYDLSTVAESHRRGSSHRNYNFISSKGNICLYLKFWKRLTYKFVVHYYIIHLRSTTLFVRHKTYLIKSSEELLPLCLDDFQRMLKNGYNYTHLSPIPHIY